MSLLTKIKELFSNKKDEDHGSEVNEQNQSSKSSERSVKKSFRDDDFDKLILFDENVDGVECFGYFLHSKKYDDYRFGVYEIYLSDEFRTEITLKLVPKEFEEQEVDLEQFKWYLHENIKLGHYDLSDPRKIWEKYTCRYQTKVDETGKYVLRYCTFYCVCILLWSDQQSFM